MSVDPEACPWCDEENINTETCGPQVSCGQVFSHLNQAPHDSSELTETELLAFECNHDICVVDNHFAARVKTYLDGLADEFMFIYVRGNSTMCPKGEGNPLVRPINSKKGGAVVYIHEGFFLLMNEPSFKSYVFFKEIVSCWFVKGLSSWR